MLLTRVTLTRSFENIRSRLIFSPLKEELPLHPGGTSAGTGEGVTSVRSPRAAVKARGPGGGLGRACQPRRDVLGAQAPLHQHRHVRFGSRRGFGPSRTRRTTRDRSEPEAREIQQTRSGPPVCPHPAAGHRASCEEAQAALSLPEWARTHACSGPLLRPGPRSPGPAPQLPPPARPLSV